MKRYRALACAALAAALVAGSCTTRRAGTPFTLEAVRGTVEIARGGGGFKKVDGTHPLGQADRVRTGPESSARASFSDGSVELGPGAEIRVMRGGPFLRTGSLLAAGKLDVTTTQAVVPTSGAVRIDRSLVLRVGAFEGAATIMAGGDRLVVDRFREASISEGFMRKVTRPLRVDEADAWDRRLIGDELEMARSIDAALETLRPKPAASPFVVALLGGSSVIMPAGLPALPETDVAGVWAIVSAAPGNPSDLLATAVRLRTEGADWAVIAATLRADPEKVLTRLTEAISSLTIVAQPPPAPTSASTPGPRMPPRAPAPSAEPRPTPTPAPTAQPPTPTPPTAVGGVVCDVVSLLLGNC